MQQYVNLVNRILKEGEVRDDRTGVGIIGVFDHQLSFNLQERFPLVTIKETRWKTAFLEMLWFLRGEQNTKYLLEHGCKLWEPWAKDGFVGPIYGWNWRHWGGASDGIDQIGQLIHDLQFNPTSRRHIVSAWDVDELPNMALPPCHYMFQCYVSNGNLDMKLHMRSSDVALGLPFNIAQYAMLLTLLARATGLQARYLHVDLGDAHLYSNTIEPMKQAILNQPYDCPTKLVINTDNTDIDGYKVEDFSIEGYEFHPFIKMEVAV